MGPPGMVAVRDALQRSRGRGVPFARAWPAALATDLDADTFAALTATEPAWRHAYEGAPATREEEAVRRMAEWLGRVA